VTGRLAALHPGAAYHCKALETPRFGRHFDRLIRPETLDADSLRGRFRTHPARLRPLMPLLSWFMRAGNR
jgi:hypothetical protein